MTGNWSERVPAAREDPTNGVSQGMLDVSSDEMAMWSFEGDFVQPRKYKSHQRALESLD